MAQVKRNRKASKSAKRRKPKSRGKRKSRSVSPGRAIVPVKAQNLAMTVSDAIENVLIRGDLKELTAEQRIEYTRAFCKSLGLNLLTRPVEYILFREYDGGPERLELYIRATGAAQLRKIHRISIVPGSLKREIMGDHCIVGVDVRDGWGTTDSATGSVSLFKYKNGQRIDFTGREWDNAIMKAETKSKRRATLSICGLAMLDDSQLDTMQVVGGVTPEGRIYHYIEEETGSGSHEAAQDVAKRKIAELQERNKAPGPAPQPAAKPSHIEPDKQQPINKAPKNVEPTEEGKQNVPPPVKPEPWKFAGSITFDITKPGDVIVTGDVQNLFAKVPQCLPAFKWGEDSLWHVKLADTKFISQRCVEINFEIVWIKPTKSSAPQRHDGSGKPTAAKGGSAGRQASSAPAVVEGAIERVNAGMAGKYPVRQVTLLLADTTKPTYGCFDKDLFEDLDKGLGKQASFITKSNKGYTNIVGIKKIGQQEYDEDGKTKIIQNKDREAGGRTLFP